MSKKSGQSTTKKKAINQTSEVIKTEEMKQEELLITQDIIAEATIESPVKEETKKEKEEKKEVQESVAITEKKIQDKPKKKVLKRQGVIVEAGLASVVVETNGNRFRLLGVKGNVGDTVTF
jgi:hypothetical protein